MNEEASTQADPLFSSEHTSNDLLFSPQPERSRKSLNYEIVAEGSDEVQQVNNASSFSNGLIESGQTELLTTINIYSERGANRDQVRLLYMNTAAFRIWKAMGRNRTMIGETASPAQKPAKGERSGLRN